MTRQSQKAKEIFAEIGDLEFTVFKSLIRIISSNCLQMILVVDHFSHLKDSILLY